MPQAAGIPDRDDRGLHLLLEPGRLVEWVAQQHQARKAGPHVDVRLGAPDVGLLSWAVRKGLPRPGEKRLAIRQPVHDFAYREFEGEIPEGYGAGTVSRLRGGKALVTRVTNDSIHFTTDEGRDSERFVLVRSKNGDDGKRERWLLINTTPTALLPFRKIRYVSVPAEEARTILRQLRPGSSVQAKIDGAASLTKLYRDRVEVVSMRHGAGGRPIVYTEKIMRRRPELNLPRGLVGSVLRGETYGVDRRGRAVDPQVLGGLLNSSLARSLLEQERRGITLRTMLFDVLPRRSSERRRALLREAVAHLPAEAFHLPEEAVTVPEALRLWDQIASGRHPLSREGIVIHPPRGKPIKIKLREDVDVWIRDLLPPAASSRHAGRGIGSFRYSLTPEGPPVGAVGAGLSDETRRLMRDDPGSFVGRAARVLAHGRFPSGALRAPVFVAMREDPASPGGDGSLLLTDVTRKGGGRPA